MSAKPADWSKEEDQLIVELYSRGVQQREIAEQLSAIRGRPVTRGNVEHRIGRLRDMGVQVERGTPGAPASGELLPVGVRDDDPNMRRLIELTKKTPKPLEELCDTLDVSPRKLRQLVQAASDRGFAVQLTDDHVGAPRPQEALETKDIDVAQPGERHALAIVGDLHFGSKHHTASYFKDFYQKARARGVQRFLHVGDMLDGVYAHSLYEQSARGFEEQVEVAISALPKEKDVSWFFIQGNHDETFHKTTGIDTGRAIVDRFASAGRKDLTYLGARSAYVRMRAKGERRGLVIELWHPGDKGNAYALTYALQNKINGYAVGKKPDLVAAGHWHQMVFFMARGTYAMSAGCFQGSGSSFAKSLRTAPAIGSWIIEWSVTKDGTVREISPTWVGYIEREIPREVSLG